jgi:hypothetical protein
MAMRALTDGAGRAFVDPTTGRMMVLLDAPLPATALLAGAGLLTANATVHLSSIIHSVLLAGTGALTVEATVQRSTTPPESGLGKYVPFNTMKRRTIKRQ